MAKKNRINLQAAITGNLPSGGPLIPSINLRSVEEDQKDSNFNLLDDDAGDIIFQNGTAQTLREKIDALEALLTNSPEVLGRFTVSLGHLNDPTNGTSFAKTGTFINSAIVASATGTDVLVTINLATPLLDTNYTVECTYVGQSVNYDFDNDVLKPIITNLTTTSFQLGFRALSASSNRNIVGQFTVSKFTV